MWQNRRMSRDPKPLDAFIATVREWISGARTVVALTGSGRRRRHVENDPSEEAHALTAHAAAYRRRASMSHRPQPSAPQLLSSPSAHRTSRF